jgi:hypothetical protein
MSYKISDLEFGKIVQQPKPMTQQVEVAISDQKSANFKPVLSTLPVQKITDLSFLDYVYNLSHQANLLMPSFLKKVEASKFIDTRSIRKIVPSNNRYTTYEQLSGISKVRPETLLVTTFKPMYDFTFDKNVSSAQRFAQVQASGLNSTGEFINAQIQLMNLRAEAFTKLIKDLQDDQEIAERLVEKQQQFSSHIATVQSQVDYLYDVLSKIDNLRDVFQFKNDKFLVTPSRVMFDFFKDAPVTIKSDINTRYGDLSFYQVLQRYGYSSENVSVFSDTKVFLQSLYELKTILVDYSNNLLELDLLKQRNDFSQTSLNRHRTVPGISQRMSTMLTVSLNDLKRLKPGSVLEAQSMIRTLFDDLQNLTKLQSDDSKISLLIHHLSHEYKLSSAIKSQSYQSSIQSTYNYQIEDRASNHSLIDVIIGNVGNDIIDRPAESSVNSLTSIARKNVDNSLVLSFENDYIDYNNSTYTPGSEFYVEKILDVTENGYNVSNLSTFLNDCGNQILRLINNIMSLRLIGKESTQNSTIDADMLDGNKLFDKIKLFLINKNKNSIEETTMTSIMPAVLNKANNDSALKSLLFLYVVTRTYSSKNPHAAATIDKLIKTIVDRIDSTLGNDLRSISQITSTTQNSNQQFDNTVSKISLVYSFKQIDTFLKSFFAVINNIYEQYTMSAMTSQNSDVSYTQFSHIQDTVLLATIFECVLSCVNRFVPKTFVGKLSNKSSASVGMDFYSIKSTNVVNRNSIATISSKLQYEQDSLIQLLFVILHSLKQVRDASENTINLLQSKQSIATLNEILTVLGDKTLLSLLINEQQIYIAKSAIDDIGKKLSSANESSLLEHAELNEFNDGARDDLSLLDDSLITKESRKALFSFFGHDSFSKIRGNNIRLLSIGIPSGFSKNLKEKITVDKNMKSSLMMSNKQKDIIKINVWKVDAEHQDIVFRPQSFLFELSRFVLRNHEMIKTLTVNATLDQVINSIPTRDYSINSDKMVSDEVAGNQAKIYTSEEYSFLSTSEKKSLIYNHIASHMFELYIKLLTGISVSENDFYVEEPTFQKTIDPFISKELIDQRFSKIFNETVTNATQEDISKWFSSKPIWASYGNSVTLESFDTLSMSKQLQTLFGIHLINDFSRSSTSFVSEIAESKKLLSPKMFDRIFNIAVDPDDFEIDVTETLKSPAGKESFNQLLNEGTIVPINNQTSVYLNNSYQDVKYKLRNRNVDENDLLFEKYFVTLQTVLDTVI